MRKIKITAELIPAEEGGYIIYCHELDITTEGETVDEAVAMLKDAASGCIEVIGIENSLTSLKDIRSRNWNL